MRAEAVPVPRVRPAITARTVVLLLVVLAAAWAFATLRSDAGELLTTSGGLRLAGRVLAGALTPALTYESPVPPGTAPLPLKALEAARVTVVFAAAAMSLALVGGVILGFCASSAWWAGEAVGATTGGARLRRALGPALYGGTRVLIAALRSIHELLWAVLLMAAFGLGQLTAVLAIAVPYAGVLAKVFSEMVDEAPRDAAEAMRQAGASPLQLFLFALVPRALPDMTAYALYRFECALRSSAILGFFGFPTLGYYVAASFENLHIHEVWTYLYVLFALVAAVDWWSGAVRRRLVA